MRTEGRSRAEVTMRKPRVLVGLGLVATFAVGATPSLAATPIPAHVYSPYFESWSTDSLATIASQSGAKYLTIAFLQTLSKTSCSLAWNGDNARVITANPTPYGADIANL